jgi:hypothetical protein
MSLEVKRNEISYEKIPADIHNAICIQIVELGTQQIEYQGKILEQKKVNITWELSEELMKDGRPFVISKEYTLSLDEKSKLCQDLIGWRGKNFTQEELKGFNLENILGKPCRLAIIDHINPKNNKVYSQVNSILPKNKNFNLEKAFNPLILLDLDNFDIEIFNKLSKYLQEKIKKSPEYKHINKIEQNFNADLDLDNNVFSDEEIPF